MSFNFEQAIKHLANEQLAKQPSSKLVEFSQVMQSKLNLLAQGFAQDAELHQAATEYRNELENIQPADFNGILTEFPITADGSIRDRYESSFKNYILLLDKVVRDTRDVDSLRSLREEYYPIARTSVTKNEAQLNNALTELQIKHNSLVAHMAEHMPKSKPVKWFSRWF